MRWRFSTSCNARTLTNILHTALSRLAGEGLGEGNKPHFPRRRHTMSSFDYLKTAIRQQGHTLQQVADASGMTKG